MSVASPVGDLSFDGDGETIAGVRWGKDGTLPAGPLRREAERQLAAYFAGGLTRFDLPLAPAETAFAARFRAALLAILCGETRRYGDLARDLGVSAQAIGQACGANRFPVIVPCHRVVSAAGLGGYSGAGGVEAKVTLLRHEGAGLLI